MRIVPAATPVCSARSLIASFFTASARDNLRRRARSGFPRAAWVAATDYMRQPDPILVTGATGYVGSELVDALLARGHDVRTPEPPRRRRRRRAHGRRALRRGPARGPRRRQARPTTSCTRWAPAATSPPRTARRRSTSPRRRRAPASSASSTSAGSARRTPSTCAAATRSRSCCARGCGDRLVYVRAAMIIGPGSASYDILEHLVKRLPVMIVPRWLDTEDAADRAAGRRACAGGRRPSARTRRTSCSSAAPRS